jgi:mannose-1-phosphate guanylyltransferase/mannose-6-phosphate isomerase
MLYPVVLSGGVGTRLWPISRNNLPKQFVKIFNNKSMFQKTMERISDKDRFHPPYILTNIGQRYLTEAQLNEHNIEKAKIFLEPQQKGTAPAIMLAALDIAAHDPDGVMLVLSTDNEIKNLRSFQSILLSAGQVAKDNKRFLLFSSKPTYPETGYGYILAGKIINKGAEGVKAYEIQHFKEKPSALEVEACIKAGYQWNSGIFVFPVKMFIEDMKKFAPHIYKQCSLAYLNAETMKAKGHDWIFVDQKAFAECPEDSIDCALMEKTEKSSVIKMNIGWYDVGSWKTIYEIASKDQDGNVLKGNVISINSRNSYVMSSDESRVLTTIGVNDLTIIQTSDATLILPRNKSQDVRKVTALLKEKKQNYFLCDSRTYRSWGFYDIIKHDTKMVLKKLILYSKASKTTVGNKKAKHFIVNKGKVKVVWEAQKVILRKNESVFIPPHVDYTVTNLSKFESHLIKMEAKASKFEKV